MISFGKPSLSSINSLGKLSKDSDGEEEKGKPDGQEWLLRSHDLPLDKMMQRLEVTRPPKKHPSHIPV